MPRQSWTIGVLSSVVTALPLLAMVQGVAFAEEESHLEEPSTHIDPFDHSPSVRAPCLGDERTQLGRDSRIGIGRINGASLCTAFVLSNGAFATAGHCVDGDHDGVVDIGFLNGSVEFNVPDSTSDGCPMRIAVRGPTRFTRSWIFSTRPY